ncbi:MAG: dicarboxylate/amino acid:cation symporter [Gammaproteobacteria bacterium]|nr:dicarboxylate/amino acid:cation symporter [Gammaproteobacteria bacterium]
MQFKLPGFGIQCLIALGLGALFGEVAAPSWVNALQPIGKAFLQLLEMVILPVTFTMVVTSFTRLETVAHIRRLGLRTLFWFLVTAAIAATVGLFTSLWLDPGYHFNSGLAPVSLRDLPTASAVFLDMVPGNLVDQMARGKVIPVIIFAVLFSLALMMGGEETGSVKEFFDGLAKIMMKITRWVIRLSPIGIFVFIASVTNRYGFANLMPFARFIINVYFACFIQLFIYGILLLVFARVNPIQFAIKAWPALLTAFTTSSSLATLPVTLETLIQRLKVPEQTASFVAPLGANAKMDGCGAIYPVIVAIFTASLFHISLGWQQYLMIACVATITTIGTAGVPGSAVVMSMVVLSSMGLPFTGLAMVMGMDKIIDMMRTLVNVSGTLVTATLISK